MSRETVHRWIRGEILPPLGQLEKLAQATGQTITISTGQHKEAAPHWAERLVEDGPVIRRTVEAIEAELVTLKEALEAIQAGLPLSADDPPASPSQPRSERRRGRP